jgi:hypothetical protein
MNYESINRAAKPLFDYDLAYNVPISEPSDEPQSDEREFDYENASDEEIAEHCNSRAADIKYLKSAKPPQAKVKPTIDRDNPTEADIEAYQAYLSDNSENFKAKYPRIG